MKKTFLFLGAAILVLLFVGLEIGSAHVYRNYYDYSDYAKRYSYIGSRGSYHYHSGFYPTNYRIYRSHPLVYHHSFLRPYDYHPRYVYRY